MDRQTDRQRMEEKENENDVMNKTRKMLKQSFKNGEREATISLKK
jgi:hypothetical protein